MSKRTPKTSKPGIRLPRAGLSYQELADFFDRSDGVDLLAAGIMESDANSEQSL